MKFIKTIIEYFKNKKKIKQKLKQKQIIIQSALKPISYEQLFKDCTIV